MSIEELHSDNIDLTVAIAEIDRIPDNKKEATEHRQLCGVTVYCAKFFIRVCIHSASGTFSYSIPRNFPDKKIYIEVSDTIGVATDDKIPLENV